MNMEQCCSVALVLVLMSAPASSDVIVGNNVPNVDYNPNDGFLSIFTDGVDLFSVLIEGPRAISIDHWSEGTDGDGVTGWTQTYFDGREQWIGVGSIFGGGSVEVGTYQIATYATQLGAGDFGEVEIGTHSFGTLLTSVNIIGSLPEDFNGNGTVDFGDFVAFSNVFGSIQPADLAVFDLDASGTVDFGDFVQFSNNFGKTADVSPSP